MSELFSMPLHLLRVSTDNVAVIHCESNGRSAQYRTCGHLCVAYLERRLKPSSHRGDCANDMQNGNCTAMKMMQQEEAENGNVHFVPRVQGSFDKPAALVSKKPRVLETKKGPAAPAPAPLLPADNAAPANGKTIEQLKQPVVVSDKTMARSVYEKTLLSIDAMEDVDKARKLKAALNEYTLID